MEIIGVLLLGVIIFVVFGCLGWILKLLGYVFDFLLEGFSKSIGCLFWIFIAIIILMALI